MADIFRVRRSAISERLLRSNDGDFDGGSEIARDLMLFFQKKLKRRRRRQRAFARKKKRERERNRERDDLSCIIEREGKRDDSLSAIIMNLRVVRFLLSP